MLRRHAPAAHGAGDGSLLGPPALELERDRVRIGEGWLASFAVIGYPQRGQPRLARHRCCTPPATPTSRCTSSRCRRALAADRLRRQRARLESTRRLERERGRSPTRPSPPPPRTPRSSPPGSPAARAASSAAASTSPSAPRSRERARRADRAAARALLLAAPAHWCRRASARSRAGSRRCRSALDRLRLRRAFDTEALAASLSVRRRRPARRPGRRPLRARRKRRPDPARPLRARELQHRPARPLAAPARATWPSSRRCGCSTAACRCS